MKRNCTFVYMVMCGGGVPTVLRVVQGVVRQRGTFREALTVATVTLPEGERLEMDGGTHRRIAAQYATPEFPSFWEVR